MAQTSLIIKARVVCPACNIDHEDTFASGILIIYAIMMHRTLFGHELTIAVIDEPAGMVVCHIREPHDVYGGRPRGGKRPEWCRPGEEEGWLGNPHNVGGYCPACGYVPNHRGHTRDEALSLYRAYFGERIQKSDFRRAIVGLRGKHVACFCRKPNASYPDVYCHLDIVKEWLDIEFGD